MLRDVVAVNIDSNEVRVLAEEKTPENAEAIVAMAVARRGFNEEFFADVKHGRYHNGDKWEGK